MSNLISAAMFYVTAVYVLILPVIPEKFKYHGLSLTGDTLLGLICGLYLIAIVVSPSARHRFLAGIKDFFTDSLSLSLTVLLVMMLLSVSYAAEKGLALSETARFLSYLAFFFIIKYEINDYRRLKRLLQLFFLISALLSILGFIQYFTGVGLNEKFFVQQSFGATARVAATLDNPNSFGGFLILSLFPLLLLTINSRKPSAKGAYGLMALLVLTGIMFTFSRNAWLGVALGFVVLALTYSLRLFILLGGVGALALFTPLLNRRLHDIFNSSQNESRVKLWQTAVQMFKDHPLLGVGNGNYVSLYDSYIAKYPWLRYQNYHRFPSHNSYLKVFSELGIIGGAALIAFLVLALFRLKKLTKQLSDNFFKPVYVGCFASFIAFLFMNFSDNLLFVPKATTYFWLMLAIGEALSKIQFEITER